MRILVGIKRVIDHNVKIRVKADGSGVELANVKMAINPFDEIALEEAVRLKEAGLASEVVAVSIGDKTAQETLRSALALGADRAILIENAEAVPLAPLDVARLLKIVSERVQPQLILLGKQAIDNDENQTGQMLAALLKCSQATCASKVAVTEPERLEVTREVDGGLETLSLSLPAVVTADLRLNQPRYPSLPNIMKAKSKPLEILSLASLDFSPSGQLTTLRVSEPAKRSARCEWLEDAAQLVAVLKEHKAI
ncbi:Electron transfer flavoprotein small subunit [Leminorella richardii]|uniref:Electron transfer flavoprotein subunit beta n=1 Tax=Leminorella richardii TaxID=158841 RepID=A0A2X4V9Y6_9GAMM|nr:electron transfer flavoprotein subunit beta/FixA family protein [Leminorella richardii]SQI42130.1 Electron transfer flavoprotein small subunit [Leminorella richardii]